MNNPQEACRVVHSKRKKDYGLSQFNDESGNRLHFLFPDKTHYLINIIR